jgi:bifunctional UDP-N-acetylglucosamine pyrophosphorylase / glucosamine-1-phosphate N-acetyltransferase
MTDIALIVLAAGKGTRMKSALPKVMHKIAGRSLLGHVLTAANELNPARAVVVVGPDMDAVGDEARRFLPGSVLAIQQERRGTAHAVSMAREALAGFSGTILVLYADVPLIAAASLKALVAGIHAATPAAVLGFHAANPQGYGRLIKAGTGVGAIREELDATVAEKSITLCNSGIIAAREDYLWKYLSLVKNTNAKQEFYLTDVIELIAKSGVGVGLVMGTEAEVAGVNDRIQLATIEAQLQMQYRSSAMLNGATLIAPDTVYFSADTQIGTDVVIEPNVFFGPGVTIGNNVQVFANSHIEGTTIGNGAKIGPFARLRPGAEIGEDAHIGNFVEVKKAVIGKGAKANHLTYIGDARVGAGSNIGAGTITCNYDGYEKHLTDIGARVFVGSNSALVAPVKIGDGANIAAGSVITSDIPADSLGITRSELQVREGWALRYRKMKEARKAAARKV